MSENTIALTDQEFDEVVNGSDTPVLVDFWAPWCGPCKMLGPVIDEIAEEYKGKAKVCKVDTDQSREAAMKFNISSIPTVILFKDGQVQKQWVGLVSKDDITDVLDSLV
ncbi:Thioredoxin-1 [Sedimentisphaera cyanobacteriorum]|uniref:Thioredoxin n=1 Tax=Sedimentisphaera cyanobacteriorum TaxID=1940790 RepID=A0A1Q2HSP9_9BACT|nr:thioredoxin [Sedimentisphaera cyanobacteriorum]AQQ10468.1 Thioredoxin-1 [Sedimentisphaera cyanobacteriorum]